MPRLASITSQSLVGLRISSVITPELPLGTWTDDNGNPVTVRSIISPVAMQVNGVFAVNPTVPFNIQGQTTGAQTTITNIAANTGTVLELDDSGNSTSFQAGEQLDITTAPTYTLTPVAFNVDEGSALTFNVTTTDVLDATTLYWTVDTNAGDFATSSGSFTISSNAGSFSVTPTADTTTEGAETFTVSVRTGSTSGTIVATSSNITINDTSTTPTGTDFTTRLNSISTTGWVFSPATFNISFDNSDFLVTTGQTIYISETQSVWFDEQNQTANKGAYQGLRTVTGHSSAGISFESDVVNDIWGGGTYDFVPFLRNGTGIGFISVL